MTDVLYYVFCGLLSLGILLGIYLMSKVKTAAIGNTISAVCVLLSIIMILFRYNVFDVSFSTTWIIFLAIGVGSVIGAILSIRVKMIQMPELVALLNGVGGAASAIVGGYAMTDGAGVFSDITAILAVAIGMITLVGSLIAAGKLAKIINGRPVKFKGHSIWTMMSIVLTVVPFIIFPFGVLPVWSMILWVALASSAFGFLFSIRVGGADMPITISLLNSLSGVAGAIAGMAIGDVLLVAVGGIVGASGLVLTQIMCKSMNRHLLDILLGKTSAAKKPHAATSEVKQISAEVVGAEESKEENNKALSPVDIVKNAKKVIIVPGYGMALAQAQHKVKALSDKLETGGAEVKFAIHPVAGRMPGHMNVLLCEADIPYEKLYEMSDIDEEFKDADVSIVIGANDVLNPAARNAEGTPIYGMPVLSVDKSKHIVVFNYDLKPGYAGVENPIYSFENTSLILGNAKDTLDKFLTDMNEKPAEIEKIEKETSPSQRAVDVVKSAKKVIIVPGYGMALAQAQHKVKALSDKLEAGGAEVKFAIHPVAGRMPGHMNVLLCEADIPYEKLYEMSEVDEEFKDADVAIVVGANDVLNPAARNAEGTPIYGMPVLSVDRAKHIVVFNYDLKPGYAGVENPIYSFKNAYLLLGNAKETLDKFLNDLN